MGTTNADRLAINPGGNWQLYTATIPPGSVALGTVTRNGTDTGALVRVEKTGAYLQINAGCARSLDGRTVAAAIGTIGKPATLTGGKRVNVYLDDASLDAAAKLGDGNVSEGIRVALKKVVDS